MFLAMASIISFLAVIIPAAHGGNILVFPHDGSHWVNMRVLVEELHSRGHDVTIIRNTDSWYIVETSPHYNTVTVDVDGSGNEDFFRVFVSEVIKIKRSKGSAWTRFALDMELKSKFYKLHKKVCEVVVFIFENEELMKALKDAKYDMVLTDPANGGGVLLAHYLGLPLVFNARWTVHAADLWLMRVDFVFEFPRPTMPNVIYMGGFQCKPAKPLPQLLEEFVQSSGEHGVIIMSLGTLIGELPRDLADEIAAAFAQLPQKVIWRYKGDKPASLGNNTLLVDWMPQNDLLGHPKIKLFVSHGGTNGIYEAIYHGVPIVGIPIVFDQADNLSQMRAKGVAKVLDVSNLDRKVFQKVIQEVLIETSYKMNMQRLSRLHRDQPMKPLDRAVFWIEFVMRHKGAAHLRTESYKMPWYSYHSVDVILFLLTNALLSLLFSLMLVWFCLKLCLKRKEKFD